jgi:hypothetical protein
MPRLAALAAVLSLSAAVPIGAGGLPDPAPFDAVLALRARGGGYDYRGTTGQDRKRLAAYLSNVGGAPPADMTEPERMAFFINAYNALAIQTLLENPGRRILDVQGAFKTRKHRVGGQMRTLDEVEDLLRRTGDARIHFAIVCAARSCPPLAPRAYRPEGLSDALDRQARAFINDASKNVIDPGGARVRLSKIFEWNRGEFAREGETLNRYVARYVTDPAAAAWLAATPKEPEFLEYDWSPNQSSAAGSPP